MTSHFILDKDTGITALKKAAGYIVSCQIQTGQIPEHPGAHVHAWNHIESAMALTVAGYLKQAQHAYRWFHTIQQDNGAWWAEHVKYPLHIQPHFIGYIAVGLWHYYCCTNDHSFLQELWPVIERAFNFLISIQAAEGVFTWALDSKLNPCDDYLLTTNACLFTCFESALACAELMHLAKPEWEKARTALLCALQSKPHLFNTSKQRYAMNWFYPILCNTLTETLCKKRLLDRWDTFVVTSFGCKCVSDQPWVTVAETAELALALMNNKQYDKASQLLGWVQQFQTNDGGYWMGYNYVRKELWPLEKPTWTAAAMVLAYDRQYGLSGGSHIFHCRMSKELEHV